MAALVIGIVALIFSIIPLVGALALYLAIPGALLGIGQIAWPKKKKGLSIAGLILCIIAGGISFVHYKAVQKVGEGLQEMSKEMEANRKKFEENTGIILDNKPFVPAKEPQRKVEPLKLNGVYAFKNNEAEIFVVDLENLTDKTITVFRGYLVYYDDFGKIAKRTQATYRQEIGPKRKIVIAVVGNGIQSQTLVADSIESLSGRLPLPFSDFKVKDDVKFECTEIKYAQ